MVADEEVVLHTLRVGICGYADSHYVNVFSKDISLRETHLANGDSYSLRATTIRIPFTKTPPAMNSLCSILSGSAGDSGAEALGSVDFTPQRAVHLAHQTVLDSPNTERKSDEFWKRTKPTNWSDGELQGFLTNSPWAYTVPIRIQSDVIVSPAMICERESRSPFSPLFVGLWG